MAAIEAVIFDYGGVLSTTPFAGIAEFERKMGYPEQSLGQLLFGRGASPQGPTEDIPDHDWHLLETGRLGLEEFHERLVARSEAALGQPLDLGVYAQFLQELGVGVHWMMIHRVRELRADGYRTAILTNNIKEWGRYWKGSIPLDLFDVVVFDEASQIPTEEAIPALCRATQVIIVGDEMQLPPTSFFSTTIEYDDMQIIADEDGEKIAIILERERNFSK